MNRKFLNTGDIFCAKQYILASAGSGKTYALAKRFIQLLYFLNPQKTKNNGFALLLNRLEKEQSFTPPKKLSSIVALTFTNKAADEMGERIIKFLKILAGINTEDTIENRGSFFINKQQALKILVDIIKDRTEFNVSTIDSFTNRIMKALSMDLKINPDYDISFDSEELFEYTFQRFISDKKNWDELKRLLESLLYLEETGFNGERILSRNLKRFEMPEDEDGKSIASYSEIEHLICERYSIKNISGYGKVKEALKKRIDLEIDKIKKIIEENSGRNGCFNGQRVRFFKNLNSDNVSKKWDKLKALLTDEENFNQLLKNDKQISSDERYTFLKSVERIINYQESLVLLKSTFETQSIISPLVKFEELKQQLKRQLNIVEAKDITKGINKILNHYKGVSYAFCKLGETLSHYLIDEFQDTSSDQYNAIKPLLDNATSEGGSLFVVGDKKQAIYAWRGGDYSLFDKLNKTFHLNEKITRSNYRSKREIIDFNNYLFSVSLKKNLKNFLSMNGVESLKEIERTITGQVYIKAEQTCKKCSGGYVKVMLKPKDETIEEFYKDSLIDILKKLVHEKGLPQKDVMILLRSKDQIKKVVSWIREKLPDLNIITEDALMLLSNYEIKKLLFLAETAIYLTEEGNLKNFEVINFKLDESLNTKRFIEEIKDRAFQLSPYEFFSYLLSNEIVKENIKIDENQSFFISLMEKVLELQNKNYSLSEIVNYFYENEDITVKMPENIDAIRVMTIHKSKGLESHTVIIPFYQWNLVNKGKSDIYELVDLKEFNSNIRKYIYARIDKPLRQVSETARKVYFQHILTNLVESLNLMYVAHTRAKENLFILGSYKSNGSSTTAGDLLFALLKERLKDGPVKTYETGKLSTGNKNVRKVEEKEGIKLKTSSNIRNFLKIYTEVYEENIEFSREHYGDLFHRAMSFIGRIDDLSSITKLVEEAYNKAVLVENYKDENVKMDMVDTLRTLKVYFNNIDEYWNEKEFVSNNGEILRIDRIVKIKNKFFVIDYKTGKKEKKHLQQIKKYLSLIPNSEGLLYYTTTKEIVHVKG